MEEQQFPVNSGKVPPPSQSTNLLSHQLANFATFQNNNGQRRKAKESQRSIPKLKLERILGLTSTSSNILATANDLIAYAAGAVVVIYNHKRNKQVALLFPPPPQHLNNNTNTNNNNIVNNLNQPSNAPLILPLGGNAVNNELLTSNQNSTNTGDEKKSTTPVSNRAKPISCLAFSPDGNYLAAGEMGHQPRILIWDVKEKKLLREFKSHKFGVLSLSFSPNMRYLVSIGFQHDGYLYVWDWKKGIKLAGNKVTSRVNAVSFSKDGSYFVTAGLRHVKYWYLDAGGRIPKRRNLSSRETQVLDGRSGILGVLRDANFVDVACDRNSNNGYTYFITDLGILCIFKEGRVIDKWVDLQVKSAFSISVSSNYVICTCSEGVIRLFDLVTLKYAGILPKPHPLGTDISLVTSPDMVRTTDAFYPDAVAMVYNEASQRVISVYSDRSLYIWDIRDLKKIGKYRSFIFHSDCVWGVEPCPNVDREENAIPVNSFATFSADGTVRIWNLDTPIATTSSTSTSPLSPPPTVQHLHQQQNGLLSPSSSTLIGSHRRNIYSRELVKMIYVDPDAAELAKLRGDFEFSEDQCPDFGIRSLKMSSNGRMMASGDRSGNLRVHDMNTWELLTYQEAHDSEILSIDLTTPKRKDAPSLIATASRDRLLHVFDIKSKFQLVQSLDDHSSSITAVKFSEDSSRLISCGADKGIIFRQQTNPVTPFYDPTPRPYSTYHNYSGRGTVFDMALDVNGRYVATVTGDRKLYVMSVESGKPFRICKPETADEVGKYSENSGGSLINVDLDPFSGTYAVTSGSDRCVRLFDLTNSTCIEKVCAHSELITSVKFIRTNTEEDGLRVVSTCSDGTIFIWKVGRELIAKMCARATERDMKLKQQQQLKVEEEGGDVKRSLMLLGLQNDHKRTRRSSTATAIRPTASISQMIRQGERKTFSTMSPAEQKYDEVYRKIAASSGRRINDTLPPVVQPQQPQQQHQYQSESPPSTPSSNRPLFNRNLYQRKENRSASGPSSMQQQDNGRKSPSERVGKLERLYNGLPTSHGRERTTSQALPPAGMVQYRQSPASPPRNPILRRAVSRDALIKKEPSQEFINSRKSPTRTTPFVHPGKAPQKDVANRRSSQSAFDKRVNEQQTTDAANITNVIDNKPPCKEPAEYLEVAHVNTRDNDEEEDEIEDETEEDEEEEDDGDEEEEEEIIFTPEQDQTNKPFEVSTHQHNTQISCDEEEEDGRNTPISDNETNTQANCNDDDSSEDNVDDAINRDIAAREPPRITTSLSRTTSSVNRRSLHLESPINSDDAYIPPLPTMPSSPPNEESHELYRSQNSAAFKEIKKKLEKAVKRQSITTRFLSSLGGNTKAENARPSLDHVMSTFRELADKEAPQPDKLTIDVAPPIIEKDLQEPVQINSTENQQKIEEDANSKLESALADLDGVTILLESVLETYLSTVKSASNQNSLSIIETKLNQVSERIIQTVGKPSVAPKPPPVQEEESPETIKLLEKYSSLLLSMVESKMKST